MPRSSEQYWYEREQLARANTIKAEAEYNARMEQILTYTRNNINKEVMNWIANYADKEGITYAAAQKRVRETDVRDYEAKAARYVAEKDFSDQANAEMSIYNLTMRVNRMELLKAEINLELVAGFDALNREMERGLTDTALAEFERQAGILGRSARGNEAFVHSIVNASFRGATYSERLWGSNLPVLRAAIEHQVSVGLIQGKNPRELTRTFTAAFNASRAAAETLMRTEMCRVQTDVQMRSIERNGYDEFTFVAESLTCCPECAALNGKHWKISEGQIGKNLPPIHPNCRCSAAPYMDRAEFDRWIIERSGGAQSEPPARTAIAFTDAKTVKDAEKYADRFVDAYKSKYSGNASYSGIGLDTANTVNRVLTQVFDEFGVEKISNIKPMNFRENRFKDSTSDMAYLWSNNGTIYINGHYYKNAKTLKKHIDEINSLQETVNRNIDALISGAKNDLKKRTLEAMKNIGVQCFAQKVDESKFAEATIVHECGHMLDDKIFGKAMKEAGIDRGESLLKYGGNISAYAVSMQAEYIAESFASWWYGQTDGLDPAIVAVFEGARKKK